MSLYLCVSVVYLWSFDNYGENALGFGSGGTGSLSNSDQLQPVFQFGSANPDLNYVSASRDPGGYNGHAVNYYPYHTPLSKSYEWSLSVQRQLAAGLVAEVAYVGNHGTGLSFPAQGRRPYSQYLGINGNIYNAISNYDSLQLSIKKRFGNGFSFDANYTWWKFLDEQDSSGWGRIAGSPFYQSSYFPGTNYGLCLEIRGGTSEVPAWLTLTSHLVNILLFQFSVKVLVYSFGSMQPTF